MHRITDAPPEHLQFCSAIEFRAVLCEITFEVAKMVNLHPEYLVDEARQKQSVVLPIAEWDRILDELEELDDIRAFDAAKAGPQETVPLEQAVREIQEGWGK